MPYPKKFGYDDNVMEFAVRFSDLRHADNRGDEKVKSYQQISNEIFEKTGVYISHTQLSKYKKMEDGEQRLIYPKVTQILAIAEYYDVSVEYLLGLSDSKSYEDKYKICNKEFGLFEDTMVALEIMIRGRSIPFPQEYNFDMIDYINLLITCIGPELLTGILSLFKVLDEIDKCNSNKDPDLRSTPTQEQIDLNELSLTKQYAINQILERLVKSLRQEIKKSSQKKRKTDTQSSSIMHPFFNRYLSATDNAKPPR